MNSTYTETFSIPEYRVPEFNKKVSKLNKKAGKLNNKSIIVNEIGTFEENTEGIIVKYFQFEVIGSIPKIAGWELVGAIDHHRKNDGTFENITRTIFHIPDDFRHTSDRICDHCGHHRRRKTTYILKNDKDEFKQVGSACLKDFLGVDPTNALKYCEFLLNFDEDGSGRIEISHDSFMQSLFTSILKSI